MARRQKLGPHIFPKKEMVTFSVPSMSYMHESKDPSSFNGDILVRKYKVTVEMIDEPLEVIQKRIVDLWHRTDNSHHLKPLMEMAKRYGCEERLVLNEFGKYKGNLSLKTVAVSLSVLIIGMFAFCL